MRAFLARHRSILLGLCSLLLSVQVTGAHLHLCFDGQEPPIQLHMLDADESHDEAGFSRTHSDEEVALNGDTSTRNDSLQFELPPVVSGTLAYELVPVTSVPGALRSDDTLLFAARHELPPPPRGPPATA